MSEVFSWHEGRTALLVSIPHDGREIPPDIGATMTPEGLAIPDTDWHVRRLYGFAESVGAAVISANYSRYVVDLNRPRTDEALYQGQVSTGLCPLRTFAGDPIYNDGEGVDAEEIERRVAEYWKPYHDRIAACLAALRKEFGCAMLWDAHSIRSRVPRLFDGDLPDLNIGTNDGRSCPADVQQQMENAAGALPYSSVVNGRFKGGYTTRHYGKPDERIYAMQLELAQRCYMDEETLRYDEARAADLAKSLQALLAIFQATALIAGLQA